MDGPSAGTAMFLAAYSAFTGAAVPGDVALTGEISLTGKILPVGGVTEKLQAAEEARVTRAYIPKANWQGRKSVNCWKWSLQRKKKNRQVCHKEAF